MLQGGTISPKLFTACLESVLKKLDWENLGSRIHRQCLSYLRFEDIIVLLSECAEQLQNITEGLQSETFAVVLKINMNESKVIINKRADSVLFSISNGTPQQVKNTTTLAKWAVLTLTTGTKSGAAWDWVRVHPASTRNESKLPLSLK